MKKNYFPVIAVSGMFLFFFGILCGIRANQYSFMLSGLALSAVGCVGATVLWLTTLYRMLALVNEEKDRTTPGQALALLFVPVLNIYWIFAILKRLRQRINTQITAKGLASAFGSARSIAFGILFTISTIFPPMIFILMGRHDAVGLYSAALMGIPAAIALVPPMSILQRQWRDAEALLMPDPSMASTRRSGDGTFVMVIAYAVIFALLAIPIGGAVAVSVTFPEKAKRAELESDLRNAYTSAEVLFNDNPEIERIQTENQLVRAGWHPSKNTEFVRVNLSPKEGEIVLRHRLLKGCIDFPGYGPGEGRIVLSETGTVINIPKR